jgi:hypothetical protein
MAAPPESAPQLIPYDDSDWPIVVVRAPPRALSAAEFRAHLDHVDRAFARRQPFGLLADARGARFSAIERRMAAQRIRENYWRHPGLLRGLAVVLNPGRVQRGLFIAIQALARPPYPMLPFEDPSDARRWLNAVLEYR